MDNTLLKFVVGDMDSWLLRLFDSIGNDHVDRKTKKEGCCQESKIPSGKRTQQMPPTQCKKRTKRKSVRFNDCVETEEAADVDRTCGVRRPTEEELVCFCPHHRLYLKCML